MDSQINEGKENWEKQLKDRALSVLSDAGSNFSNRLATLWTDEQLELIAYPKIIWKHGEMNYSRKTLFIRMHNFINGTQTDFSSFFKIWCALLLDAPEFFEYQGKRESFLLARSYKGPKIGVELTPTLMQVEPMVSRFSGSLKFRCHGERDRFQEVLVDDCNFYAWYMNPNNLLKARAYFGLLCINMLRILLAQKSDARIHLMAGIYLYYDQFSRIEKPPVNPNVAQEFVNRVKMSREDEKIVKGALRLLLEYFNKNGIPGDNITNPCLWAVWSYAIKPLECKGLTVVKLINDILKKKSGGEFHIQAMKHKKYCFQYQYNEYAIVRGYLAMVRDQDEEFIRKFPKFKGSTVNCYMFSRLFCSRYFKQAADQKLDVLHAFALGYSKLPLENVREISYQNSVKRFHGFGRSALESMLSSIESDTQAVSEPKTKKPKVDP